MDSLLAITASFMVAKIDTMAAKYTTYFVAFLKYIIISCHFYNIASEHVLSR